MGVVDFTKILGGGRMTDHTYLPIWCRESMRRDVVESTTLQAQDGADETVKGIALSASEEPARTKFVFRKSKCIICQKWKFEGQLHKSACCYTCRYRNTRYYVKKDFWIKNQRICRSCWPFDCRCRQ